MTPNKSKLEISKCCGLPRASENEPYCLNCGKPFIPHTNTECNCGGRWDAPDKKDCPFHYPTPPVDKDWQVEFNEKFKCIQSDCDGNGCIPNQVAEDEWEAQQCQFHAEYLLPIKEFIAERIRIAREEETKGGATRSELVRIRQAEFESGRQQGQKELIEEIRRETLQELLLEHHKNELEGKGYDFYFAIRTKLDDILLSMK